MISSSSDEEFNEEEDQIDYDSSSEEEEECLEEEDSYYEEEEDIENAETEQDGENRKFLSNIIRIEPNLVATLNSDTKSIDYLFRKCTGEQLREILFESIHELAEYRESIEGAHLHPEIYAARGFAIQQYPILFENIGPKIPNMINDKFVDLLIKVIYKINYNTNIEEEELAEFKVFIYDIMIMDFENFKCAVKEEEDDFLYDQSAY